MMDYKDNVIDFAIVFAPAIHLLGNDEILDLDERGFFSAPASTKHHGAYKGGLYNHSKAVMDSLVKFTADNHLEWVRPESPYVIGMFHDLCKMDQYIHLDQTSEYTWNKDQLIKGHGDKSIMLLSQYISLTEEEIMCIRYHMGAFTDKEEWEFYNRAVDKYPNVLWTHHADMYASHVIGF